MTKVWQLVLLWGVVIGIGTGMTALVLGATIATRWFAARRGLVVGIMTASVATGQLVFLPLLASLTERLGWRIALALMCVMLGVAAFAVLMLMRDRPSDVGLRPFGDDGTEPLPAPPPNTAPIMAAALGTLRDAVEVAGVLGLFATFFICGASTNGLIQVHLIPMCLDFGIPQVQAASLLAAMGIFDFFGTIMSGWLSDRYDNRWLLFWYYGLRGLSLVFLPFTDFSFYGLSLFAMFYGLDWIATVPPTVRLTAQRFGPERANLVFGWIFAGHQIGAGTAAFGAGLSRTLLASYLPAFFFAGALCIVAALTGDLDLEGGRTETGHGLSRHVPASPGVRSGSASRANSHSSERVLRGIDDLLDPEFFGRAERRAQLVEAILDLLQLCRLDHPPHRCRRDRPPRCRLRAAASPNRPTARHSASRSGRPADARRRQRRRNCAR